MTAPADLPLFLFTATIDLVHADTGKLAYSVDLTLPAVDQTRAVQTAIAIGHRIALSTEGRLRSSDAVRVVPQATTPGWRPICTPHGVSECAECATSAPAATNG